MASVVSPMTLESPFKDESSTWSGEDEPITMRKKLNLSQEESIEVLRGMLHRQQTYYTQPISYLVHNPQGECSSLVTEAWRRKICEWIFEVVDHFNFDRQLVGIALDFLDRSVSRSSIGPVSKREYQLSAIASVFLAVKLHSDTRSNSGGRLQLGLSTLVELSRNIFSEDLIQDAERKITSLLDWHLNPPTPLQYITYFLRLLPRSSSQVGLHDESSHREFLTAVYDNAKYLAEVASFSLVLAFRADASTVAYASLLSAVGIVEATMRFPPETYRIWLQSLNEIHTSFTPFDPTVQMAQRIIRELCPTMFVHFREPQVITPKMDQKRSQDRLSPTCVREFTPVDESPTKRHRTDDMEDALPNNNRSVDSRDLQTHI